MRVSVVEDERWPAKPLDNPTGMAYNKRKLFQGGVRFPTGGNGRSATSPRAFPKADSGAIPEPTV